MFAQDITRALLNIISNGFYATLTRKSETFDKNYEPALCVATKNLGETTEITIRDNGQGIASEIKEKIFNPFFTTKPPGEGTGLGLSLSHDIIVKQHGGLIEFDTQPESFTQFKVRLVQGFVRRFSPVRQTMCSRCLGDRRNIETATRRTGGVITASPFLVVRQN